MMQADESMEIERKRHLVQMVQQSLLTRDEVQQQAPAVQLEQEEQIEAPLVQNMEVHAEIDVPAPALAHRESRGERKKRQERESALRKARDQREAVRRQEGTMAQQRALMSQQSGMTAEQLREERTLLQEKLKAVKLEEQSELLASDGDKTQALAIRHRAQAERARLAGEYARMLPLGSEERKKAMAVKEKQEIKANQLRRQLKVEQMEEGAEKRREKATLKRHGHYDDLKAIFRRDNPLAHEDAVWTLPTGQEIVNVGRAFFGGTKPMYIFEDRQAPILRNGQVVGYKQYLFKEAVNCIGMYKPEGALVTEAAAALQEKICGPYSIPAYAAVQGGKVLGSFQEKIETIDQAQRVDLFSWQAQPQDNLPPEMKKEILREHTLDWLLCNFDTKGENFLHRTDGHLCSFDKEASFSKLKDPGAAHMSTDYKPHANDTLYNTLFTEFAEGRLTLDLSASLEQVQKVEGMYREEYLGLFAGMLDQKYGPAGPDNQARTEVEEAIWSRKSQLREEYRSFYTDLIRRRREALARDGKDDDCGDFVDAAQRFRFRDELEGGHPPIPLLSSGLSRQGDELVHGLDRQELITEGATTYHLTLTEEEAKRMKEAANGFLTYRKGEDGFCVMRPSMPEKMVFAGQEVEFRKNYKRFTRAVAALAVTPEGEIRAEGAQQVNWIGQAFKKQLEFRDKKAEKIFRTVLAPLFQQDKALCGDQKPEEALEETIRFLSLARGYNQNERSRTANNVSMFNVEATGSIKALALFAQRLTESEEEIRGRIEKARQEDPTITDEMAQKMIEEDLPVFQAECRESLATMARCATQDMNSDEVFLLGTCSANAQMLSCATNPAEQAVDSKRTQDMRCAPFFHHVEDLADEIPEAVEERITAVTGQEFHLTGDASHRRAQLKQMENYTNYAYHTAGVVGEVDGAQISLESFAAESYQITGPGFTDKVGIGLFRDHEAFKRFYGKNAEAILTPDQMRRYQFKCILGEGL